MDQRVRCFGIWPVFLCAPPVGRPACFWSPLGHRLRFATAGVTRQRPCRCLGAVSRSMPCWFVQRHRRAGRRRQRSVSSSLRSARGSHRRDTGHGSGQHHVSRQGTRQAPCNPQRVQGGHMPIREGHTLRRRSRAHPPAARYLATRKQSEASEVTTSSNSSPTEPAQRGAP